MSFTRIIQFVLAGMADKQDRLLPGMLHAACVLYASGHCQKLSPLKTSLPSCPGDIMFEVKSRVNTGKQTAS